jgi:hypothetical protein
MAVRKHLSLVPLAAVILACAPAPATAVEKKNQTITFTSTAPSNATVGGPTYTVSATASSGLAVSFKVDEASVGVCTISGSTVSFIGTSAACTIDANQEGDEQYNAAPQAQQSFGVGRGSQAITFTSTAPTSATVGGPSYTVTAKGGVSGEPVILTLDPASKSVCTLSGNKTGSTVSFVGAGTCTIDANQAGNPNYEAAPQKQQSFSVGRTQTITFTSGPPSSATVGGSAYTVTATATSGLPVSFSSSTPATCTAFGATVRFVGPGVCAINADQVGDAEFWPAPQVQQLFVVAAAHGSSGPPAPIVQVKPVALPDSSFKVIGASLSLARYTITFVEHVVDPGTFTWVMTFENGKFGAFAARVKKCKAGSIRLKGKCRPARVLFASGRETVASPGSVTFTVRPTRAGVKALKKALKQNKGLPVVATVTYQSLRGGKPVSRVQSLIVKGRR